jgi:uncharacterized protein YjbJ (UPF0337 family)
LFAEPEQEHDRFETVAVAQSAQIDARAGQAGTGFSASVFDQRSIRASGTNGCARTFDLLTAQQKNEDTMNKDRIQGSVEQAKGKIKEVAGKATGDTKLENEGKAQKVAGKVQNTIGGLKDAVKEAVDD